MVVLGEGAAEETGLGGDWRSGRGELAEAEPAGSQKAAHCVVIGVS